MEAPLHKPCGTKHWSTQKCPLDTKSTGGTITAKAKLVSVDMSTGSTEGHARSEKRTGPRSESDVAPDKDYVPENLGSNPSADQKPVLKPGPVDTNNASTGRLTGERGAATASRDTPKVAPAPRRGRPATGFDKKAYDRKKAAERRAKLKAEGK